MRRGGRIRRGGRDRTTTGKGDGKRGGECGEGDKGKRHAWRAGGGKEGRKRALRVLRDSFASDSSTVASLDGYFLLCIDFFCREGAQRDDFRGRGNGGDRKLERKTRRPGKKEQRKGAERERERREGSAGKARGQERERMCLRAGRRGADPFLGNGLQHASSTARNSSPASSSC